MNADDPSRHAIPPPRPSTGTMTSSVQPGGVLGEKIAASHLNWKPFFLALKTLVDVNPLLIIPSHKKWSGKYCHFVFHFNTNDGNFFCHFMCNGLRLVAERFYVLSCEDVQFLQ